jgi:hypothetical protein
LNSNRKKMEATMIDIIYRLYYQHLCAMTQNYLRIIEEYLLVLLKTKQTEHATIKQLVLYS